MERSEFETKVKVGKEVKRFFTDGYDFIEVTEIDLEIGLISGKYADGKCTTWHYSFCEIV